jgi:hypothetical protein
MTFNFICSVACISSSFIFNTLFETEFHYVAQAALKFLDSSLHFSLLNSWNCRHALPQPVSTSFFFYGWKFHYMAILPTTFGLFGHLGHFPVGIL